MQPVPKSSQWPLKLLLEMIARVPECFGALTPWPSVVSRRMARQFLRAVRDAEAFLRRLLLVLALEIEPTLVDTSKAVRRATKRVRKWRPRVARFVVLDERDRPDEPARLAALCAARPAPGVRRQPRGPVPMARLYRRLDRLTAIAADPMRRARRLAFWLARYRPDWILTTDPQLRLPGRYGTEITMTFDAIGYQLFEKSKRRPPPMGPPARWGPSITVLDW
jgi:hypothetical protein